MLTSFYQEQIINDTHTYYVLEVGVLLLHLVRVCVSSVTLTFLCREPRPQHIQVILFSPLSCKHTWINTKIPHTLVDCVGLYFQRWKWIHFPVWFDV